MNMLIFFCFTMVVVAVSSVLLFLLSCSNALVSQPPQGPFIHNSGAMVSLHGQTSLGFRRRSSRLAANANRSKKRGLVQTPPPEDPSSILASREELTEKAHQLADWLSSRRNVLCITGAGLSTESGIPDYRGHKGSYHVGHKPILHQQFLDSLATRKRYWGRSLGGWKSFSNAQPNKGHAALASLEQSGFLGVDLEDRADFYRNPDDHLFSSGHRKLSILTQNVDSLHEKAGSNHVVALHGTNKLVECTSCGHRMLRNDYQDQLELANREWLLEYLPETITSNDSATPQLRPDGDSSLSNLQTSDYDKLCLPSCPHCSTGFFKPTVVFFGDTVPKHRVTLSQTAVQHAGGILVVGTSLAVHSAFRHVRAASQQGTEVAILNVGETRAEAEGLDHITKIPAPIGDALEECVKVLGVVV